MRTIQEIFNLVISKKLYDPANYKWFMCHSLDVAFDLGLITRKELNFVSKEVQDYVTYICCDDVALKDALNSRQMAHDVQTLLNIYKDWENRPIP